jgi:hypothetical protein
MPDARKPAVGYSVITLTNKQRHLKPRKSCGMQMARHNQWKQGSAAMRRHQKRDTGQDLVEYAIVFPVLMMLLLGVFDLGRIIYSYNAISNLAREGTRYAVVPARRDDVQDIAENCPGSNPIVQDVCGRALALPGTLTVAISQGDPAGQPDPDVVHVEVEYNGDFLASLVREMMSPHGDPLILRAAATMRLE